MIQLYDYYRSTACYRVRIALQLKNLSYESIEVHLLEGGGQQHLQSYRNLNAQELVPTLVDAENILSQSLGIIEYLEETRPQPPLLPQDPKSRADIRALALSIACDIHPLNNLRVTQYLREKFRIGENEIQNWYHHWLKLGFDALEAKLQKLPRQKDFCYGNSVSLADICLIPQVYNAKRFEFDLASYPLIQSIDNYCLGLDAFRKASPDNLSK